jgi:hypothetical protein
VWQFIEIMALDWHRPAGKSIRDGALRSLARKGLDILDIAGVSIVGEYNHSSRHLIDGLIRNHVEEALGSAKYEEICKQHTVLNNIHYCQSGPHIKPYHSSKNMLFQFRLLNPTLMTRFVICGRAPQPTQDCSR